MTELFSPLVLRSGATLRNRVAKAAMEEGMAGCSQLRSRPTYALARDQLAQRRALRRYRRWLETRASSTQADTRMVAASQPGE